VCVGESEDIDLTMLFIVQRMVMCVVCPSHMDHWATGPISGPLLLHGRMLSPTQHITVRVPTVTRNGHTSQVKKKKKKKGGLVRDESNPLWDGEGCGLTSSCCEFNQPPYFCKHLKYTTSADMEIRLFSFAFATTTTGSLLEIFIK